MLFSHAFWKRDISVTVFIGVRSLWLEFENSQAKKQIGYKMGLSIVFDA